MFNGLEYVEKIKINPDLLTEIFSFNPINLESMDGAKISTYNVALAQYLIYFRSQYNMLRIHLKRNETSFDAAVSMSIDSEEVKNKKFKTKADTVQFLLEHNSALRALRSECDKLREEVMKLDGIESTVSELISTFKRELTRREKELFAIRQERK